MTWEARLLAENEEEEDENLKREKNVWNKHLGEGRENGTGKCGRDREVW